MNGPIKDWDTLGSEWRGQAVPTLDVEALRTEATRQGRRLRLTLVGETLLPFGSTDFAPALMAARDKRPTLIVLNVYGWDLVHALKGYTKLELAKEKIGIGGMLSGEQIGRPLGYANNAGIWGLLWDPKVNTESSRQFIQAVVDKYNHTPTSRCYLGYAAMTQI